MNNIVYNTQQKILHRDELAAIVRHRQQAGERAVFTNGCFDLLHVGHVRYLQQARSLGDLLVVGVNSDESVRRLKGASRPLVTAEERTELLASLECVNHVTCFEEDTPKELIADVQPHFHVKGGDYRPDDLPEAPLVRDLGGEVVILPFTEGRSTSQLAEKIVRTHGSRQ